jgi:tRNA(adenine34) deaminase
VATENAKSPKEVVRLPEYYMQEALKEAMKAYAKDEAPIGTVIVLNGKIIARGHNERELKQDATLHAEMIAIRKASRKLGSWRLPECELYVTLEPCAMCAGAIVQSRIRRVYIGASDPKAGAAGSVINVLQVDKFNHQAEVLYGVLEQECSQILKDFFMELRNRKVKK